jgi:prepilin-type N-terminal cleavage/methylation domain-containing protein
MKTLSRRRGFSLIEVLVVIVILATGILTVVRVFPRGFVTLRTTRDYATAQGLGRAELERLQASAPDLPDDIIPTRYIYRFINGTWTLVIESDPDVSPDEVGPGGDILEDGTILINNPGGNPTAIFWRYYNDANRSRRVIAEGGKIPAPKPVGNYYGSLRMLNFGPIIDDPNLLVVYGNDMEAEHDYSDPGDIKRNPQAWRFIYDNPNAQLWCSGLAGRPAFYKVNFSYWAWDVTFGYRKVDVIDVIVSVTENANIANPREALYDIPNNAVSPFDLRAVAGNPVDWVSLVDDSVRVNRVFERIPDNQPFAGNYPYEFKALNPAIGMLLFNPISYNYREPRRRGTSLALTAQINYDVYNWHVLRDDFRADRGLFGNSPRATLHKLPLDRIKAFGDIQNDRRRYPGLDFPIPDGLGGFTSTQDFLVVDMDSGGIVMPRVDPNNPNSARCYKVDYLRGTVQLAGPGASDPELATGGITVMYPGSNQVLQLNVNPAGRNYRVFYQAHNDWSVQVQKASSRYAISYGLPLSIGQCYVGTTPGVNLGLGTRIYFPRADIGNKVAVREIWYLDNANVLQVMRDQDFRVLPPLASDPLGLPYIDIRQVDQNAVSFEFTANGFAARGVTGTSVRARVLWNSNVREDTTGNSAQEIAVRMQRADEWGAKWRRTNVETYLSRRDLD